MSFLETALKDGNLGSPEICKFVLKDPAAAPSYAADPVMAGFKIAATRADIDGTVANGSPAAAMLLAARRHYFDVVRNTIVESSLYADEFVSQQVKISFRPHLLVKDNTPEDTTRQIVDLFNAFVPTADSDIEEYAKEQAKLLGIPLNTAVVVGSLVLTRQGAPTPDMRLVDNLKRFYRTGNGGRVFPDPKDPEGDPLNPDMDGLRLAPGAVVDLDNLPSVPPNDPRRVEVPKGDPVAEKRAVESGLDSAEKRAKKMECSGPPFERQKLKVAQVTIWIESKIEWEIREIRGECFRIEIWVPVLKVRDVYLVLYVLTINVMGALEKIIRQTLECAIKSALDIRVVGIAFVNLPLAYAAFGALFEVCMRFNEASLACVVPELMVVTEVENDWH